MLMIFSSRTRELWAACKQLFNVSSFELQLEIEFLRRQAKARQMLLGLASATALGAFSFFSILFLLEADSPEGAILVRLIATVLSVYFAFTAYFLLFEKGGVDFRNRWSISFAYVVVLGIPFVDMFRPLNQVSYDVIVMASTTISISAISRLTHRNACIWLLCVVSVYFTVKMYFFGIFGPDSNLIAGNPFLHISFVV
jgi:hypothetical protein